MSSCARRPQRLRHLSCASCVKKLPLNNQRISLRQSLRRSLHRRLRPKRRRPKLLHRPNLRPSPHLREPNPNLLRGLKPNQRLQHHRRSLHRQQSRERQRPPRRLRRVLHRAPQFLGLAPAPVLVAPAACRVPTPVGLAPRVQATTPLLPAREWAFSVRVPKADSEANAARPSAVRVLIGGPVLVAVPQGCRVRTRP